MLYDEYREIAERGKNKDPEEREVLVLPSRRPFRISSKENADIFRALFKDKGEEYLKFTNLDEIMVCPIMNPQNIDFYGGSLVIQLWLQNLSGPGLDGNHVNLNSPNRVRGVFVSGGLSRTLKRIKDFFFRKADSW